MNPEIALQILSNIAKISGTILAMFMAMVVFALRDEDMAESIFSKKLYRVDIILGAIFWAFMISACIYAMTRITPPEQSPYVEGLPLFVVVLWYLFSTLS